MKEQISKIFGSFSAFWKAQEKKRKLLYIGILVGVVILAVVLAVVLNTKQYVVLYEGLESNEAGEIVTQITELGVEATLTTGGKITVPKEQESSLRMQLGTMGYPKNPLSEDPTAGTNLFATEFEKREQARLATQRRLIATFETLEGVESAIVTIDIPQQKDTVITVNSKPSTASIVLHLKPDFILKDDQINGIRHIAKTSISGLLDENISLHDGTGKELIAGNQPIDVVSIERTKFKFKQEFEQAIKQEVMDLLIAGYGEDGVKVAVNAKLNYDKQVSEDTKFTPSHEDGSGMTQHEDKQNGSGTTGVEGGVIGVEPNADGTYPTGTEEENGAWSQSESSTSYLVNTLKQQTEKEGYYVEDLSVSVILYTELLADDDKLNLTTAVARAAGVREELVSITNLPKFGDIGTQPAVSPYPFGMTQLQFLMLMAVILILIIVFIIAYMITAKTARRKRRILEQRIYEAAQYAGERGQVDGFFGVAEAPVEEGVLSLNDNAAIESKEEAVKREISEFAHHSPEIVAQLLKSWLREDEKSGGKAGSTNR